MMNSSNMYVLAIIKLTASLITMRNIQFVSLLIEFRHINKYFPVED